MSKNYSYDELRDYFKDMYLIVEVSERNNRGFASRYKVIGYARAKRDIEKAFQTLKYKYPNSYIHQTYRDSEHCSRFKIIDGELTKIPAYSAEECAEMFRNYYGVS